jgi:hypothetical protein
MTIYHLLLNRLTLFIINFSACSVFSVAEIAAMEIFCAERKNQSK